MSSNRIQKLLFSEYCDFEDMVLVESPFAQTDRNGKGIRQVHLGLTPTKLILATDILPLAEESPIFFIPGLDPEIETFELISVFPIQCINLSVFHQRRRKCLKAHFSNSLTFYFELGGLEKRNMFWNLWCEKVKFLHPDEINSSNSETSAGTSSSCSTMYLINAREIVTGDGQQLWCQFGCDNNEELKKWNDRYVFIGTNLYENAMNYKPLTEKPAVSQFLKKKLRQRSLVTVSAKAKTNVYNDIPPGEGNLVNRFGYGIQEGCGIGLYLSSITNLHAKYTKGDSFLTFNEFDQNCFDLIENGVKIWELSASKHWGKRKHRRRYGFNPYAHFMYGLGMWNISLGDKVSVQLKRVVSMVDLQRENKDEEFQYSIAKRHLISSTSLRNLHNCSTTVNIFKLVPKQPIYFWTVNYWYNPQISKEIYGELQKHVCNVRNYCHQVNSKKEKKSRRLFFRMKKNKRNEDHLDCFSEQANTCKKGVCCKNTSKKYNFGKILEKDLQKSSNESSLEFLQRELNSMDSLNINDFDSTTLAEQITRIDRDLFLKIRKEEVSLIVFQKSTKNTPNIQALIAFAHRISCLIATELLKESDRKTRGRLINRFINTSNKCYQLCNFQSCKTIISALQSPAIYRLNSTWAYMKKRHGSTYRLFEKLCRIFRDPRLPIYQKAFAVASQHNSCLPYIGDLIGRSISKTTPIGNDNTSGKTGASANFERILNESKSNLQSTTIIIEDISNLMESWQNSAAKYNIPINKSAREYLLKARYNPDQVNFFKSFNLEE